MDTEVHMGKAFSANLVVSCCPQWGLRKHIRLQPSHWPLGSFLFVSHRADWFAAWLYWAKWATWPPVRRRRREKFFFWGTFLYICVVACGIFLLTFLARWNHTLLCALWHCLSISSPPLHLLQDHPPLHSALQARRRGAMKACMHPQTASAL